MTVEAAWLRQRLGLGQLPVVTGVVFAVTAAMNVGQFAAHGLLGALQRTPQGLHGDWWRSVTSLFVQDGGLLGTLSNLAFLLVIGALAEQVLPPWRWLACYFGTGLVAEFVGYGWQPRGAGNSVAICGLAAALVVALVMASRTGDERLPQFAHLGIVYWCAALLATLSPAGLIAGVAGAVLVQVVVARGIRPARPVAVDAVAVTAILLAFTNIHGAGLAAGFVIAGLLALVDRRHKVGGPSSSSSSSPGAASTTSPAR
jgi:membrane associated rhomboid family serine protease